MRKAVSKIPLIDGALTTTSGKVKLTAMIAIAKNSMAKEIMLGKLQENEERNHRGRQYFGLGDYPKGQRTTITVPSITP